MSAEVVAQSSPTPTSLSAMAGHPDVTGGSALLSPSQGTPASAALGHQTFGVPVLNAVVLPGRRLVMELLAAWLRKLGHDTVMTTNADAAAVALRASVSRGLILVDAGCTDRLHDRQALVSRCREQGAEILAVMADDDPVAVAGWVEAGATGVLSHDASLAEVADVILRLSRHEVVMGVAVREGLLARLRERRAEEADRAMAFSQLTRREAQVLRELATGASPDGARLSYVSLNTVRSQIRSVLAKLGVNSVVAAVALAYRSGWLSGDGSLHRPL